MTPGDFEQGKIHISQTMNYNNFPEVGYLTTNTLRQGRAFQILTTVVGDVLKRYESDLESNLWGPWQENDIVMRISRDSVDASTPMTSFELGKITICEISSANNQGLPSAEGTMVTDRVNSRTDTNYQDLYTAERSNYTVYRRKWISGGWTN